MAALVLKVLVVCPDGAVQGLALVPWSGKERGTETGTRKGTETETETGSEIESIDIDRGRGRGRESDVDTIAPVQGLPIDDPLASIIVEDDR